MSPLPPAGAPAFLRDAAGLEHFSRIVEVRADGIVVAAPPTVDAGQQRVGAAFHLLWVTNVWARSLPVRVTEIHADGPAPIWVVAGAGASATERRRGSVRVPVAGGITVACLDRGAAGGLPLTGRLVDVTDGALHARIDAPEPLAGLTVGTAVRCAFTIGGADLRVDGRVGSHRRDPRAGEEHIVVTWTENEAATVAVRELVHGTMSDDPSGAPGSEPASDDPVP